MCYFSPTQVDVALILAKGKISIPTNQFNFATSPLRLLQKAFRTKHDKGLNMIDFFNVANRGKTRFWATRNG